MASIDERINEKTGKKFYVVRYRTPGKGSRQKTFKLKRDAHTFITSIESSKLTGEFVDPGRSAVTVATWAPKWLAGKTSLAESTRSRYQDILTKYVVPRWGTTPLAKVTHEDVQQWITELELSPASVRKVHRVLSMILDYAVRSGRLARNVAEGVDLPRVQSAEKRYLTHSQLATLANASGPWRLVILFLGYTGLRWGELAALRVRNLDLLRRRAIICESYSPVRGEMVLSDTKGHTRREVPIPKFLVKDLYKQIEGKGVDDLVFTGPRGAILRSQTLQQTTLPNTSKAINLDPPLTPHELRHTAASLAIASGADVKVVQTMLGHKSATMTLDLYGHLFEDRLDTVADAMDKAREAELENSCVGNVLELSRRPS